MSVIYRDAFGTETNTTYAPPRVNDLFDDPGPCITPDEEESLYPYDRPEDLEGFVPNAAGAPPYMFEAEPQLEDHVPSVYDRERALENALGNEDESPPNIHGSIGGLPEQLGATETQAKTVAEILAENEFQHINQNTLIFEYGPFQDLETKLRDHTEGLADVEVAQLVVSHIRQAIHDAVSPNSLLAKNENTETGLFARIKALRDIEDNMKKELDPLLKQLELAKVRDVVALKNGLRTIVSSEISVLEGQVKDLCPPSLGQILFNSIRNAVKPSTPQLVGNARAHRNKELVTALSGLQAAAKLVKDKAGDDAWEKTHGPESIALVEALSKRIKGLTNGVEDQVDSLALRKGFNQIKGLLDDAADASVDPDLKTKIEEAKDYLSEFIKALTDALSKLFNRSLSPA